MKRTLLVAVTLTLFASQARARSVFKVFEQLSPGVVKINGGLSQGLKPGMVLIAHDEARTYGWVTLLETGETVSNAAVTFEEIPGRIRPGLFVSLGPRPLAPAGSPGAPERSPEKRLDSPWRTHHENKESGFGEKRDGLHLLRRAIDMDPGNSARYSTLADALMERQRFTEAIDLYKRAVRLAPEGPEADDMLLAIAQAHRASGNPTLARKYEQAVAVRHQRPEPKPAEPPPAALALRHPEPLSLESPPVAMTPEPAGTPWLDKTSNGSLDEGIYRDPFDRPLPHPDRRGQKGFTLRQVLVEGHESRDAPDDYSYQLLAIGKPLGGKLTGGLLLMNRWNLSEGEQDAVYAGLNVTYSMGGRTLAYATGVQTFYSGRIADTQEDSSRVTFGLSHPWQAAQGQVTADVNASFGIENSDDTWGAGLTYRQALSQAGAIEVGYDYTYNSTIDDGFLQDWSASYTHKLNEHSRFSLEYTMSDPLFAVAAGSPAPSRDHIWRLSYSQVR